MRFIRHGLTDAPAIAVVGVWDPLLPSHQALLDEVRECARARSLASAVVLIDPPPAAAGGFGVRYGTTGWPVYDSVAARIGLILDAGIDCVVCTQFEKTDLDATAAQFLDALRSQLVLDELWLGALQLLGPGAPGKQPAVADYAKRTGLSLRVLPLPPIQTFDVRSFLARGELVAATDVVGHPPIWDRPSSGSLRLHWQPGAYRVVELRRPSTSVRGTSFELCLSASPSGPPELLWPGSGAYLAFVAGPADIAAHRSGAATSV